jgi:hypothetical protein
MNETAALVILCVVSAGCLYKGFQYICKHSTKEKVQGLFISTLGCAAAIGSAALAYNAYSTKVF